MTENESKESTLPPKFVPYVTGRPTKYEDWMPHRVIELMRDGATAAEVARNLAICRDTFFEWVKVHKEFSDAYKTGKELTIGWWDEFGRTNLVTHKDYKLNVGLYAFIRKNQHGWTDKIEQTAVEKVKDVSKLSDDELHEISEGK